MSRSLGTCFFSSAAEPSRLLDYTAAADFGLSTAEPISLSQEYCGPNKLFEYILARKPVLVSPTTDQSRIVTHYRVGQACDSLSPEGIRAAAKRLIQDGVSHYAENLEAARKDLCWGQQERVLIDVYRQILLLAPQTNGTGELLTSMTVVVSHPLKVVDLGVGNIGSVLKMLTRLGARAEVLTSPRDAGRDAPIVLPGVGHFSRAADALHSGGWRSWLDAAHASDVPILGICLGAQLMCLSSEEGPGSGLGWIPARVRRFPSLNAEGAPLRVPHMGWQTFTPPDGCLPFSAPAGRMYYAQSYFIEPTVDPAHSPYQSEYGGVRFAAAVRSNNAIGLQFHPEKSHRHGMALLRHWLAWAGGGAA